MPLSNLKMISAGAGSGKTYRLTQEMTDLLVSRAARPAGIIATTFTKRAAAELKERVRVSLLRKGMTHEANELKNALIGTVHGLGVKLLKRFAYEAGVSPQVDIIAEEDHQRLFNLSMTEAISVDEIREIERLCEMLSLSVNGEKYNWRKDILQIVDIIRGNNFDAAAVNEGIEKSWAALAEYLPPVDPELTLGDYLKRLRAELELTVARLENNEDVDSTKKTQSATATLRRYRDELQRRGSLPWANLCKLANYTSEVGAKSRELVEPLVELAQRHPALAAFQDDLRQFGERMVRCAWQAIAEYDRYKKNRGRIDYTDMEVMVLKLLDHPHVRQTLRSELDLLMVDEFQDTSPIQLALFLTLSELAKQSVWVGDPKQSIYGFRGAEPRLMNAVMNANGPVDPANIQKQSWRSREDIVYACNALFTKAFPDIAAAAVTLEPVRTRAGGRFAPAESAALAACSGVVHWHFTLDGSGRISKEWTQDVIAKAIGELLADPPPILPKGAEHERPLRPGDVAVLCRTNYECRAMADALSGQGIRAAIARTGLLETAEATLILACLRYLLNPSDSLSVAEIMLFGSRRDLATIVDDRLDYLATRETAQDRTDWGRDDAYIGLLDQLRASTTEHSSSEMINLLLERLDLRRVIVAWGSGEQRLSNVDELRRLAVAYEDNCHRQHRAASLGGFMLYLDGMRRGDRDEQGASEQDDAVNVLTYHRSKGLEWPAVVLTNLDQRLRADVWGMAVEATTEEVDLSRPLANRWLRYWVNPYGRQTRGVDWLAALQESPWQEAATATATAEEARLLYVGCTRARDFLIFPTNKNGAPWVDRAFERGGGLTPVLSGDSEDAPFDWNGHEVTKNLRTYREPRHLPGSEVTSHAIPFIAGQRAGRAAHPAGVVTEQWLRDRYAAYRTDPPAGYFAPPPPDPATDEKLLAQAIAAYLAGRPHELPPALQHERAAGLLDNYLAGGDVSADHLTEQGLAFAAWLTQTYPRARSVRRRVPLRTRVDGRGVQLYADWLLETAAGELVLIQDAALSPARFAKDPTAAVQHTALTQDAVEDLMSTALAACWVHLPLAGCCYPLVRG